MGDPVRRETHTGEVTDGGDQVCGLVPGGVILARAVGIQAELRPNPLWGLPVLGPERHWHAPGEQQMSRHSIVTWAPPPDAPMCR
jgi:hypothetical protein